MKHPHDTDLPSLIVSRQYSITRALCRLVNMSSHAYEVLPLEHAYISRYIPPQNGGAIMKNKRLFKMIIIFMKLDPHTHTTYVLDLSIRKYTR